MFTAVRTTINTVTNLLYYKKTVSTTINYRFKLLNFAECPVSDRQLAEVLKSCDTGKVNYTDFLLGRLFIKLVTYDNFARCKKKKKSGRKGGRVSC